VVKEDTSRLLYPYMRLNSGVYLIKQLMRGRVLDALFARPCIRRDYEHCVCYTLYY
jgi:hypothetical protein